MLPMTLQQLPSVSVIVPLGKLEGNFLRCVESALRQTHPASEVLIVANNGISIAHAHDHLASLAAAAGLKILDGSSCRNANDARNMGAQVATSEWIALLDSDDWWEPEHLQHSLELAETSQPRADFVYGSIRVHSRQGQETLQAAHFSVDHTAENYLLAYRPAQTSTYVVKRAVMKEHPWSPSLRRHQDYEWFARISRLCLVAVKPQAEVHVEWMAPRRHKAHRDCWSVIEPWRPYVLRRFFRRHHRNLLKSAIRSADPFMLPLLIRYVADALVPANRYLRAG